MNVYVCGLSGCSRRASILPLYSSRKSPSLNSSVVYTVSPKNIMNEDTLQFNYVKYYVKIRRCPIKVLKSLATNYVFQSITSSTLVSPIAEA